MGIDSFAEGLEARDAGKPISSNPYPKGSAESEGWLKGWLSRESVDDGVEQTGSEDGPGVEAL